LKIIAPRKNLLNYTKNKTGCKIELSEQLTELNFISGKTHFIGLAVEMNQPYFLRMAI